VTGGSAGDTEYLGGDVAVFLGGDEHIDRGEFGGLTCPSHRGLEAEGLELSPGNVAGINGVHTGPGATELTLMPLSMRLRPSPLVKLTMAAFEVA